MYIYLMAPSSRVVPLGSILLLFQSYILQIDTADHFGEAAREQSLETLCAERIFFALYFSARGRVEMILAKAAVRRHAMQAWFVIVGSRSMRLQKSGLEFLHRMLQRQLEELLRACACMKMQGRSKTSSSENVLLVRELLFSQIPAAPPTVQIALSLSKNSFRRICRHARLIMSKKVSERCPSSLQIMRLLLGDLVYAILLRCVTTQGVVLVTEDAVVSAVRHLRLCDVYTF